MTLQHLRSSTANKRPTPGAMGDGQLAINTNANSTGLFFKDSSGALVKVGPVHIGTTAPNVSPASGGASGNTVGEQWLDTTGGSFVLKIWDGSAWRSESGTFVDATGDTMTGALVMDNQQQVRFRETTANGTNYIALQAPASVASDKTITLPDVTGTVVTTGDTGTVTSTMLLDGTILNADINASAAIAGTKISPDFGSQTVQTTGIFSHALGTASAPTVTFTGDTNTGIYSPGADQVAISTNGTGRLFITSSGQALVGTSSAYAIDGLGPSDLELSRAAQDSTLGVTCWRAANNGWNPGISFRRSYNDTQGSHTAVPSGAYLGTVRFAGSDGTKFLSGAEIRGEADGQTWATNDCPGRLVFSTTADGASSLTERLRITSAGLIGINTGSNTPTGTLELRPVTGGAGSSIVLTNSDSGDGSPQRLILGCEGPAFSGIAYLNTTKAGIAGDVPLVFRINSTERARIDSSGRLLVGASTARSNFGPSNLSSAIQVEGTDYSTASIAIIANG